MMIRRFTLAALVLAAPLVFAACKKDASLRASKSDCDDACTHATALHSGKQDPFGKRCPQLCINREWTVGDARCVSDAKAFSDVKNCGAVAKAMIDLKEARAGRHGRPHRRRGGPGRQGDDGQDQAADAPSAAPSAAASSAAAPSAAPAAEPAK
ncbi:MAG TPA: hypothetical protein VGM56_07130 [Byssovorax sp.]|jgi:hypothetical protein